MKIEIHNLSEKEPSNGDVCLVSWGHYWRELTYFTAKEGRTTTGFYDHLDSRIKMTGEPVWFLAPPQKGKGEE